MHATTVTTNGSRRGRHRISRDRRRGKTARERRHHGQGVGIGEISPYAVAASSVVPAFAGA